VPVPEISRLSNDCDWADLDFFERERTPESIIKVGIRLHVASLSLSKTKQILERLGFKRSHAAIHNWV
jgi:transposase-like protein